MKKWVCETCGYIHDGETPLLRCPLCGAPKDKFFLIPDDKSAVIERARITNALLMKLASKFDKLAELAEKGMKENPDPSCKVIFNKVKSDAKVSGQMIKAEIQAHINKSIWG